MIDPTKTKPGDGVRLIYINEDDIYRVDLFTQWRFIPEPKPSSFTPEQLAELDARYERRAKDA